MEEEKLKPNVAVVESARKYIGCPFKHRGRTRRGMDCAGLVILAFRDIGVELIDLKVYGRQPFQNGLMDCIESNKCLVRVEGGIIPGDMILFKFVTEPHHLGIAGDYIHGGLSVIHSFGNVNEVVEHRIDKLWEDRIICAYRYKKV